MDDGPLANWCNHQAPTWGAHFSAAQRLAMVRNVGSSSGRASRPIRQSLPSPTSGPDQRAHSFHPHRSLISIPHRVEADSNLVSVLTSAIHVQWAPLITWSNMLQQHTHERYDMACQSGPYFINVDYSLWPSDPIWRQRSGSILAQVMACCLTALNHYLNQCRLIISEVQ